MNSLGKEAEMIVLNWLTGKKYILLEKNFSWKYGEIDLIMMKQNTLRFIEVRSRDQTSSVHPAETISQAKICKIKKTASYYLSLTRQWETSVSFDCITVIKKDHSFLIEHYKDAY